MDVRVLQTLCKRAFWVGCSSPPHFLQWNTWHLRSIIIGTHQPASHSADCVSHSWLMLLCCNFHIENCWSLVWATVPWILDAVRFLSRSLCVCAHSAISFCDNCVFSVQHTHLLHTLARSQNYWLTFMENTLTDFAFETTSLKHQALKYAISHVIQITFV